MHSTEIADAIVRATARPASDPDDPRTWSWVEASVWTDRMLAAMGNGVRGGKWHSLIDKVYAPPRFADDFVALCRTRQEAETVLVKIQEWVEQHALCLHPDKTRVGNCMEKGNGFEFLGYRFEAGRRWVRPKSRKALRDKLREKTGRTRSASLETIITELNPILKGWFGYFQHAHRSTFRDVDGFVRRRLRAILRKREKRPAFGRTPRDHIRWPNAFFAKHGLFTLQEAQALASQSRCGNYQLESCVRENRMHSSEGGEDASPS